ncbi:flagellar motor switch protein FliN/FliY [Anaerovibrio lipolyticus DSM 3074]|uniref:Flagellar motor switch protein FliN n=3 Tax=Anaerovibrio lipolyticus TaxID=82374 RepID=A0A0B2JXT9_9FIRM|nr:flagellar motor switch phosphatase FliY [Anaerovibrio lipolyticus]KHM53120.1 flagellar motor switch protein FliN [Anaerovibrio lipolyticus]SHI34458.1 flagellar motor switch protein FliN/FliY [Anaerovibrio lipolyticus DSM 3074]
MGDMLTQEEIDALMNGGGGSSESSDPEPTTEAAPAPSDAGADVDGMLSDIEKDALGEIGNISMGSAATTLSVLLGHKVNITTPTVSMATMQLIKDEYPMPYLIVEVGYVIGINGNNILAIQAQDASIIADLMMGGDGLNPPGELTEIHMSAVGESMNQMMGTVATSLSTMFNKKIDISPPRVNLVDFGMEENSEVTELLSQSEPVAKISFRMEVDGLIDSEIMQILPVDVAKEMVEFLMNGGAQPEEEPEPEPAPAPAAPAPAAAPAPTPAPAPAAAPPPPPPQAAPMAPPPPQMMATPQPMYAPPAQYANSAVVGAGVPVQSAQFAPLTNEPTVANTANISLIQDVPLQVTVELGRAKKSIKEILEFSTGSIIELDKLAGEPVDIHVNGQLTAKGEVVVIDENFGVRITEIVSPMERVQSL